MQLHQRKKLFKKQFLFPGKKYKGNYTNGAVVHSKSLINDIFNAYPNLTRTCHFGVESQIINDNVCLSFDFTDSLID